jgi:hypothetical protein
MILIGFGKSDQKQHLVLKSFSTHYVEGVK